MVERLIERRLASRRIGDLTLLDAVEDVQSDRRQIILFFDRTVPLENIIPPGGSELVSEKSLGETSVLSYSIPLTADLSFTISGQSVDIVSAAQEVSLMAGTNALAAIRNGESAEIVLDWLAYHIKYHSLGAAVILDRAKPDIVILQAGCDTLKGDPLASLAMSLEGIVKRDAMVIDECVKRKIPVVMTLGGGYSKQAWEVQYASITRTLKKHGLKQGQPRPPTVKEKLHTK